MWIIFDKSKGLRCLHADPSHLRSQLDSQWDTQWEKYGDWYELKEIAELAATKEKTGDDTGVAELLLDGDALRKAVYGTPLWEPDDSFEKCERNERDAYQVAYGEARRTTPW